MTMAAVRVIPAKRKNDAKPRLRVKIAASATDSGAVPNIPSVSTAVARPSSAGGTSRWNAA
jgi:hypothetical protein